MSKAPSNDLAMVELDVRIAEREFRRLLDLIRVCRENYEGVRERNYPLGVATRRGRQAWELAVLTWVNQAVELQALIEKALRIARAQTATGEEQDTGRGQLYGDLSAIFRDDSVPLPPVSTSIEAMGHELAERLARTETNFDRAAELASMARTATDEAYLRYRKVRSKVSEPEAAQLRGLWRKSLVDWCTALGKRESAREHAILARRRADMDQRIGDMYLSDYVPEEDSLF